MSQNQNKMKIAVISEANIEHINAAQAEIKTMDEKDVVLVAYEK
ncbi:MAG: hypothetical protein PHC91_04755 [Eubacteriales bacterium]|nr:hypothetical protein [Eubacteriales bacterium]